MANHPREAPPPSRYGRSKNGTYFYVVHSNRRNSKGLKLYHMVYRIGVHAVKSSQPWTLQELLAQNPKWLKRKPSCFAASR